jgi:hypothetical protein
LSGVTFLVEATSLEDRSSVKALVVMATTTVVERLLAATMVDVMKALEGTMEIVVKALAMIGLHFLRPNLLDMIDTAPRNTRVREDMLLLVVHLLVRGDTTLLPAVMVNRAMVNSSSTLLPEDMVRVDTTTATMVEDMEAGTEAGTKLWEAERPALLISF